MAKDFRAGQIRTTQVIASASTGAGPSLLIADSGSPGVDYDGSGIQDTTLLANVGTDVFIFVSGTSGSLGASTRGATLFAGDVYISGAFSAGGSTISSPGGSDTQVQYNNGGEFGGDSGLIYNDTSQTLTIAGDLLLSGNSTIEGDLTVNGTTTTVNTDNLVVKDPLIYIGSGGVSSNQNGGLAIASGSSTTDQALVFGRVANDVWGAGKIDVEAGEIAGGDVSGMSLVGVRAGEFQIGSGSPVLSSSDGADITLRSAGGSAKITITPGTGGMSIGNSGGPHGVTGSDIRFGDTSSEFGNEIPPQPGTDSFFFVSGTAETRGTATRGTAVFGGDVVSSGSVFSELGFSGSLTRLADGTDYLIGGANITITSASNGAITIVAAAVAASAATGTFNVPAPSEFVTTASVSLAGGEGFAYTADSAGTDTYFFVSGTIGSKDSAVPGTSVFGGDVYTSGTMHVSTSLFIGDADLTEDGDGDLTITAGRVVFVPSEADPTAFQVITGGAAGLQLAAGSGGLGLNSGTGILTLTSSQVIAGSQSDEFGDTPPMPGVDTSFFVSGSLNSKGTSVRGTSVFGADVVASGTIYSELGISGSLTRLTDGSSYLIAGDNITISSASNGSVTITGAAGGGGGGDSAAQYLVLAATASLDNERIITVGTGISGTDGGAGGAFTLDIVDSVVATVSGTTFTGVTSHELGLSGSLTRLDNGTSYLIAGTNITITSGSNEGVTIASTASGGDSAAQYLVLSATGSLDNERVITVGTGMSGTDGGAGGAFTLDIVDSVVATVSGTTFTGATTHELGMSGSLTKLSDGTDYLVAGSNITITSASNGAITIAGAAGGGATSGTFNEPEPSVMVTTASVSFAGGQGVTHSPELVGSDAFYFVSGTIGSRGTAVAGASIFGGDVVTSGSVFSELGFSGSLTRLADGTDYLVAGANITITSASNGAITIVAAGGGGGATSGTFNEPEPDVMVTTASVSFAGAEGVNYSPASVGEDTLFFVSGAIDSAGGLTPGTSVFGGDVVISGTLNSAGGQVGGGQYGGIYIPENGTAQTIVDGVAEIVDFSAAGGLNMSSSADITPDASTNKITVGRAGAYLISFGSSFSGANNAEYFLQVRVNNAPQAQLIIQRLMNSVGDVGSVARSAIAILSEDDEVELWVEGDTTTVTFVTTALTVSQIA